MSSPSSSSSASSFSQEVDIVDLGVTKEIEALEKLRPQQLNMMSNLELMRTIDRIRAVNDHAEPYNLMLSHLQLFCQVIYNTRKITDLMQ